MVKHLASYDDLLKSSSQDCELDKCSSIYGLIIAIVENHYQLLLNTMLDKPEKKDMILKRIAFILDAIVDTSKGFESLLLVFHTVFQSLLDTYLVKLRCSPEDVYEQWKSDEKEAFWCYPKDIGDSLVILGDSSRSVVEYMPDILMAFNKKYFNNLCHWLVPFAHQCLPYFPVTPIQKQLFSRLVLKASHSPIFLLSTGDRFPTASLARSDATWQEQYIHLQPASTDSLEPSFVYIGACGGSSTTEEDPLLETDSSPHLASGTTSSLEIAPRSYTFIKSPGYRIVLEPCGDRWKAMVHDQCFPGLSCSYSTAVAFENGYCLENFITKDLAYQSHHIHLISTNNSLMVYIGSLGLKGGSRCPGCKYLTWPCYGCEVELCNCCQAHCDYYSYGVCSGKVRLMQQLQQEQENRNKFCQQQEEIEDLKSKRKALEEDLMQEESSLKISLQKGRAERTARSLALVEELASKRQAIHHQSFLDETKVKYNKFVSNLELEVTLKESVEQETTVISSSSQSEENHYYHLEMPSEHHTEEGGHFSDECPAPTIHPALPLSLGLSPPPPSVSHYKQLPDFSPSSDSSLSSDDFQKDSDYFSEDLNFDGTVSMSFSSSLENLSNPEPISDAIVQDYCSSEWLVHSLVQELIQDPLGKANPITLEHFNHHWTNLSQCYSRDQQIKLLDSLWEAKQRANLTLLQLTHILEIVLAAGQTGYDMACREQPDKLVHLKHYWLLDQVSSLSKFASSASACSQLVDALAHTHLSPSCIPSLLSAIREENDLPTLLNFFTLVANREVPEFIVLSTIYEKNSPLAVSKSKPHQWLTCLLCELSLMHLSKIDSGVSNIICPILYNRIKEDPTIAPSLEKFIYTRSQSIVKNPLIFIDLLELIYNYQIQEEITTSVFKQLAEEASSQWIAKAVQLITTKLFLPGHTYSVEELLEQIVESGPPTLYNSPSPDHSVASSHYLKKNSIEKVLTQQVVENLKPTIQDQLHSVTNTYKKELAILEGQERALKERIKKVEEESNDLSFSFQIEKEAYKDSSTALKEEEKKLRVEIDKLEKENKENIKKSIQKVKETEEKLGEKSKDDSSKPPSVKTGPPKEKSKLKKLADKLTALLKTQSNVKTSYKVKKGSYETSSAALKKQIKILDVDLLKLESQKKPIKLKIENLSKEDATNFSDYSLYKEILDSFCKSKSILRTSENRPFDPFSKSLLTTWSKLIKNRGSNLFNSHSISEIISGINQAAFLSNNTRLTKSQHLDLLANLFPFCRQSKNKSQKDPMVVIFLAIICAFQNGQVSLVIDSKELPISESDILSHLPFFKLLFLTATKRDSMHLSSSCKSDIVYGKSSDFSAIPNLIAYDALKQKQQSIDSCYHSPSSLLQSDDSSSLYTFKYDPISSWDKQAVSQWANYVQHHLPNPDCIVQGTISTESIAVTQHAAELIQKTPLTTNQRYGLLILLYPSLDKSKLLQEAQKDNLVSAMFAAVRSLQAQQSHIIPSTRLDILTPQKPLFDLLSLTLSSKASTSCSNLSFMSKMPACSEKVNISNRSIASNECLSDEQLYNIIRIIYPDLYENHSVRLDLVGTSDSSIDTLRGAIVEHIQKKTSHPFTSLVQIGGYHWTTVSITQEGSSLYHAYYANSINNQEQDHTIESALNDSGISTIHKLRVSQQQDGNSCGIYAIAYANEIAKAIKSRKTNKLLRYGIAITPEKINDLRQRWTTLLDIHRNKTLTLGQDDHYVGQTINLVVPLSTPAVPAAPVISHQKPIDVLPLLLLLPQLLQSH